MRKGCVAAVLGLLVFGAMVAPAPGARDALQPFLGEWSIKLSGTGTTFEACWAKFESKNGAPAGQILWRWGSVFTPKNLKLVGDEMQWDKSEYWKKNEKGEDLYQDVTYHAKVENGKLSGWARMPTGDMHRFTGVPSVDKVNVAGKWVAIAEDDPDQIERTITVKQKGDKITGTYDDGEVQGDIKNAKLEGNKLSFEIDGADFHVTCEAVAKGDRISGTYDLDGDTGTWTGKRQRKMGEKIVLYNGKDLRGWISRNPKNKTPKWTIKNGRAYPLSGGADIYTRQKFQDFKVRVKYNFPKPNGNSGVYVRGRYEVQLLTDHGRGTQKHGCGAIYSRVSPTKNVTQPQGEPGVMEITLVGQYITVVHNGETIVDNAYLEGITGGALDEHENEPGPLMLQAHGEAVEFLEVEIWPLL